MGARRALGAKRNAKKLRILTFFEMCCACCDAIMWSWKSWWFVLKIWTATSCMLSCCCCTWLQQTFFSGVCPARSSSSLPLPGEGSDCHGCLQGPAGSWPQLLQSQSQVQCQSGRQHDHPVHCSVGPAGQRHQHFLHACPVRFPPATPLKQWERFVK